jgi:hypothetical protein
MQMARYAPEVTKHYNMLKDKKKKGSEWELRNSLQKSVMSNYNAT